MRLAAALGKGEALVGAAQRELAVAQQPVRRHRDRPKGHRASARHRQEKVVGQRLGIHIALRPGLRPSA
jgi:hypothetical protein